MPNATPSPRKQPLLVTAAIITDGSKILISKRRYDSAFEGGKWEFPGGKVEFGEHPEACLKREIVEELDLQIEIVRLFDVVSYVYQQSAHIVLVCYLCTVKSGVAKAVDVEEVRWVERADLGQFEFAAADLPIVAQLTAP